MVDSVVSISGDLPSFRQGGLGRYVDRLVHQRAIPSVAVLGVGHQHSEEYQAVATPTDSVIRRIGLFREAIGRRQKQARLFATHFALYASGATSLLKTKPHVIHFHGPWAAEARAEGTSAWKAAIMKMLEKRVYKTATRAITLSHAFKTILERDYGFPHERIHVIPGGVDVPDRGLIDRKEARAKLGWPTDGQIIVCVRRLARRMGIDVLIEAMAEVRTKHPDLLLMLVGTGYLQDELRATINRFGLSEQIRMLGFVPDDGLPYVYAAADFSVVPSQSLEGFGLITLESLVEGTPVLVTPVGGLPEVVEGLDRRLIFSGQTAVAIADRICEVLNQPGRLPNREVCRGYAADTFAWPKIAEQILGVYRLALQDRPGIL